MAILSLFIINKHGGLVFSQSFSPLAPKLSINDQLRLAGTFHGLAIISDSISPISKRAGIRAIEADTVVLCCLETRTGTKFILTAEPGHSTLPDVLSQIYVLYTDYVLKVLPFSATDTIQNPFYELMEPIRCELFNHHLIKLLGSP